MSRIAHVAALPWSIALRRPLATSRGPVARRRGFLVQIADEAGTLGVGEAAPHPFAPDGAVETTRAALADAATWLRGAALDRLDALLGRLAALDRAAATGLDMALHDLVGRRTARSVGDLLGGARRTAVSASVLVDADAPDASARAGAAAVARGYGAAKLKLGPDLATAVARFAATAAAAPGLRLRADANGAWSPDDAVAAARALRAPALDWIEQPVAPGDLAGMARVRHEAGVAVAADESVTGAAAVRRLADAGAADVVVLKLVQVGGLAAARATADAAARAGMDVCVTTSFDTSLGTAAALALATALPVAPRPCGVATVGLLADDLALVPLVDGPAMAPPPGPGLGITIDPEALARCHLR